MNRPSSDLVARSMRRHVLGMRVLLALLVAVVVGMGAHVVVWLVDVVGPTSERTAVVVEHSSSKRECRTRRGRTTTCFTYRLVAMDADGDTFRYDRSPFLSGDFHRDVRRGIAVVVTTSSLTGRVTKVDADGGSLDARYHPFTVVMLCVSLAVITAGVPTGRWLRRKMDGSSRPWVIVGAVVGIAAATPVAWMARTTSAGEWSARDVPDEVLARGEELTSGDWTVSVRSLTRVAPPHDRQFGSVTLRADPIDVALFENFTVARLVIDVEYRGDNVDYHFGEGESLWPTVIDAAGREALYLDADYCGDESSMFAPVGQSVAYECLAFPDGYEPAYLVTSAAPDVAMTVRLPS